MTVSEYEAAVKVGMSPQLLRWFTKYAPKQGESRKLPIASRSGETAFFDEQELIDFDQWLKQPWPSKDGKRPPVPTGIREEIRVEANGACAICQSNGDKCEAAHLDPVSRSKNNHPENLLWLCSNHHTAYDNGLFGPNAEDAAFVQSFKTTLHFHKQMLWRMQTELSQALFLLLQDCRRMGEQLRIAKTEAQRKAVEVLARRTLALVPKVAPVSHADPNYEAYKSISADLTTLSQARTRRQAVSVQLQRAEVLQKTYTAALGFVGCPLCKATGTYDGVDCPVCHGDRELPAEMAARVDISRYAKIDCPLCRGGGRFNGDDCPECGGEGRLQSWYAVQIDVNKYDDVRCPLCRGGCKHNGDDCPECRGEGRVQRWYAEQIDVAKYDNVRCPLCRGGCKHNGDDCPECRGEGEVPRWYAEQMDVAKYDSVRCPLCRGGCKHNGDDCPECRGEGEVPRWYAEQIDVSKYDSIRCPLCGGGCKHKGDDCPACGGEGEIPSWRAEQLDLSAYADVACPACSGRRRVAGDDCALCDGNGKVERWRAEQFEDGR